MMGCFIDPTKRAMTKKPMKILRMTAIAGAALILSACASSATDDRLTAIEGQLENVQRTADQALDMAKQAQSRASGSAGDVSEAQRLARQAMDMASETAEQLARMQDECCGGK